MWDSRIELQVHYATCRSLALPAFKADELNDMVATMIEQLDEVEDLWDEVPETARMCGPDNPRDDSLLKDWSNVVTIKCIVNDTLAAIDRYTFPNWSPRYSKENLSYPARQLTTQLRMNSTNPRMDPPISE